MEVTLTDLPLLGLFERIRRAFLLSFVVFVVLSIGAWFVTEEAVAFLLNMYEGVEELVYTNVSESFFVRLKLAATIGFAASMPWILWQLRSIVEPMIRPTDRRASAALIPFALLLFYGGLSFALLAVLPLVIRFFLSFGGDGVEALIRFESMVSFTTSFAIPFALIFQFPVVVFFLARIGVLTAAVLRKYRKYSVLGIFIVSAILTPADIFSQVMMAIPLMFLYEISILLARIANRAGERAARSQ